jgi:hypothetical protein
MRCGRTTVAEDGQGGGDRVGTVVNRLVDHSQRLEHGLRAHATGHRAEKLKRSFHEELAGLIQTPGPGSPRLPDLALCGSARLGLRNTAARCHTRPLGGEKSAIGVVIGCPHVGAQLPCA